MKTRLSLVPLAAGLALCACTGRSPYWDRGISTGATSATSFGLASAVALVDDADHRVVLLTASSDHTITTQTLPIGHNVASVTASTDGARLFVLSTGDQPRRTQADEFPSLTVIDPSAAAPAKRYDMTGPLSHLAIDPGGHWAVAYASGNATSFVENPNELVLFDLTAQSGTAPLSFTIQSFGGTPQQLTFTPPLMLPVGPRHLLIVQTNIDVTLVDLDATARPPPEVTVRLTSGSNAQQVTPVAVAVDAFDPSNANDARIALRAANDRNVYTFTLGAPPTGSSDEFSPIINLTDVGGVPSDLAFVRTDAGLRVAALVPSTAHAVLVDPDTSITTAVAVPASYSNLSLVTSVVPNSTGTDVAMLWNGTSASSGVALWTLGQSVGQPYFSIEVLGISQPIASVTDVLAQGQELPLKVLESAGNAGFFVLDLQSRMASPLPTQGQASLEVSPDGKRMWAFQRNGTQLAAIDFATLTPVPLTTDLPIAGVFDIAAKGGGSGRSLIAVHQVGTLGATVFDALKPDTATAHEITALLLEGP